MSDINITTADMDEFREEVFNAVIEQNHTGPKYLYHPAMQQEDRNYDPISYANAIKVSYIPFEAWSSRVIPPLQFGGVHIIRLQA